MGNYQNTRHHKGPREMVTGGEWIYGRNPVEEAYKKLVNHRDNNGEINFDELIGLLGEALDD